MKSNIRTNVIVNIIRTVTLMVLSFITFPYVCRILTTITEPIAGMGQNALGLYTWAMTFVYYFVILARIGVPNIAVRECAKVKNDKRLLSHKAQEFFIIQAFTTIFSFILMVAIIYSVGGEFKDNANLIFLLSINFLAGVFSFEWIYIALEKQFYLAIRSIIILSIVAFLVFKFVTKAEDYYIYAFIMILTTVLSVVSNLIFLRKEISLKKTMPYNFRQYFKPLTILFCISLAVTLYDKTDTFILGFLNESKEQVASYSVGIKAIEIIIGVITGMSMVFMPRSVHYWELEDKRFFKNLSKYSLNICFFIALPAIATMATLAVPLTVLISGDPSISWSIDATYGTAPYVLISLVFMILTYSVTNLIYTQILIPMKKEKIYLLCMGVGVVLNIALSLLLGIYAFPSYPSIGIAIGTIVADVVVLVLMIILTWKHTWFTIFNWNNLKIIILGAIVAVFTYFIWPYVDGALLAAMPGEVFTIATLDIVIMVGIDAIIYLGGLLLLKENLVSSFLHRKKKVQIEQ